MSENPTRSSPADAESSQIKGFYFVAGVGDVAPDVLAQSGLIIPRSEVAASEGSKQKFDPEQDLSRIDIGDKAGLRNVDRLKVHQIIYEMSKNSEFYRNEQRKAQKTQERIDELLQVKSKLGPPDKKLVNWVEQYIISLESSRDLSQTWIHVDMDAFYASVEIRDNPSLRGKCVAVGDNSMISTSSYEARKFGVRSAMPGFIGKQLCPDLIFVKPNFKKYEAASEITREIYSIYDPNYEPLSLDEAGLNVSDYLKKHPDTTWEDIVVQIRRLVFERTQLTCSCGIGCNRRLAKLAAEVNKPDFYFRIEPNREAILKYISPLPVRKLWGVGKVTEQQLNGIGVKTVEDLFRDRFLIAQLFSEISFKWFISSSLGIGGEYHSEDQERKSIGRQRTFQREKAPAALLDHLSYVCKLVAQDLAEENLKAKCITLVTKSANFQLKTRAKTIGKHIYSAAEIFEIAREMLEAAFPLDLRLIGVRLTHFENEAEEVAVNDGNKPITKFFQKTSKEDFQKRLEAELASRKDKDKPISSTSPKLILKNKGVKEYFTEPSPEVLFKKDSEKKAMAANSTQKSPTISAKPFFKEVGKDAPKNRKRERNGDSDSEELFKTPTAVIDLTQKSPEPPNKKAKVEAKVEVKGKGTLLSMLKRPSF